MSVSKALDAGRGAFVLNLVGSNASIVNAIGDLTLASSGLALQADTGFVGAGGTSNPRAALDVSGDVRFAGNLYQNGTLFVGGGGGGGQWATSNGSISYGCNVGIGTPLPAVALDVSGALRSTAATFEGAVGPAFSCNVAWTSSNAYSPETGTYVGTCQTVDAYGTMYAGEWLQLQFPSAAIALTAVTIATATAASIRVLGSADGSTWFPLAPPFVPTTSNAIPLSLAPAFSSSFARLVVPASVVASSNVSIGQIQFAGTVRSPQTSISVPRIPTYGLAPTLAQPRGPVGLQAHYPFGASLFDGGASNLTLTAAGGVALPQYVPGQTGTACLYLANEGNVTNGPGKAGTYLNSLLPVALGNATVACWVFFTRMPYSGYTSAVWSAGTTATEGIQLLATQTIGKISLYANTPAVGVSTPVVAVDLCTWVHVAVTFNVVAKTLSLYLNGVLASYAFNASLTAWGAFTVGDSVVPGTVRPFAGFIDDMRVFARILGNAEIMACSTLPLLPLTSNAIAPTQLGGPWVLGGGGSLGNDVSGTTAYFSFEAFTVADSYGRFTSNVGLSNAVFAVPGAIAGANVCLDLAANRAALDAVSTRPPAMFTCALSNVALPLTVAFWMRPLSTSNLQYALCCAGSNAAWGYQVSVTPSGQAAVDAFVDGVAYSVATASNALAPGAWAHVCATLAPGSNAIYLNGALAGVTPLPAGSSNLPLTTLSLGAQAGSNYAFCGQLDEVRIFGRALAPTEVASVASTTDTFAANQTTAITFEGMTVNDTFGTLTSNANIGSKAFAFAVPGRLGNVCLDLSGNATGLTNTQSVATVFYALPTPLTLPFTVAFWMNPTVTNVVSIPVCFGNATVWGFEFVINAASQLYTDAYIGVTNYSIAPSAATLVQAGLWNHVVATLGVPSTGTGYNTLFLNGAQVAQSTNYTSGALGASSGASAITQLRFGNQIPNTAAYRGQLDEFRMFNRALTPPEVNRLYAKHAFPVALAAPEYGVIVRVSFDGSVDDACGTYANPASAGTLPLAYTYAPAVGTAALDLASNALVLGLSNTPPAAAVSWAATPALPMSVSFLMNVPTSNAISKQYVLSYGNAGAASPALSLALTPGGQLTSEAYVNSVLYATPTAGTTTVTSNTWVHVVSTLGAPPASSNTLFVNGALIASSTSYAAGALTSSNGAAITTLLAGAQIGSNYAYRGGLDDLRVFNRALLPAEVSCLYSQYSYPVGGTAEYGIAYGLIAHIPFEGAGLQDVLGTLKNPTSTGTLAAIPFYTPGRVGTRCLDFTNNVLSATNTVSPTLITYTLTLYPMLPFTCSFWIYMTALASNYVIPVCFGGTAWGYEFVIQSNGYLYLDVSINGTNYNTPTNIANTYVTPGAWVHLVGTLGVAGAGTGYSMCYINGNWVSQSGNYASGVNVTVSGTPTPMSILRLGHQITNYYPLKGYLDEIRLYNRALSAAEVRNLYMSYTPSAKVSALGLATPSTLNGAVSSSRLGPYFPFSYSPLDVTGTLAPAVTGSVGYMPFRAGMQAAYFPNEANVIATPTAAANYMTAPFLHTPGLPVSVATWAYFTKAPQATGTTSYLFAIANAAADGIVLRGNFGTTVCSTLNASGGASFTSSNVTVAVGTWTHLAAVFTPGASFAFYANGTLVSSNALGATATALAAHGTMTVGSAVAGRIAPFAGYLADLRVYTRALAASEVLTMFQVPLTLAQPGALALALAPTPTLAFPTGATVTGTSFVTAGGPVQNVTAYGFTCAMPCPQESAQTYATCPLPAGLANSVSVVFWLNMPALPTVSTALPTVFQLGSLGVTVVLAAATAACCLNVMFNGAVYPTACAVSPATWYHVALTYSFPSTAAFASSLSIYVNGSPVPAFTVAVPGAGAPVAATALVVGNASPATGAAQFAGYLQEFQVHSRVLSAAEIGALFARASSASTSPALLGWWPFENSLADATGNGFTGAVVGPLDFVAFSANARTGTTSLSLANNPGVATTMCAYVDAPLTLQQTGVTPLTLTVWMNVRVLPPPSQTSTPFSLFTACASAPIAVEGWVAATAFGVNCFDRSGNSNVITLGAPPSGWTHIGVAWGDGSCRVYVNGVLSATAIALAPLAPVHYSCLRFGNSFAKNAPFNGWLDDARLHNRILSASDVWATYVAPSSTVVGTAPNVALTVDGSQTTTGSVGIGVTAITSTYALDVVGASRMSTPTAVDAAGCFDFEGANPLADKSGNLGCALAVSGAVTYVPGRAGVGVAAHLFNDVSAAVLVAPWTPSSSLSVACWVMPAALPNVTAAAWALGSLAATSIALAYSTDGLLFVTFGAVTTLTEGVVAAPNAWVHVAVVFVAGSAVCLFINGTQVASVAVADTGLSVGANGILSLGDTAANGGGQPFVGAFDDVWLFARALTATEVVGLWTGGTGSTLVVANSCVGIGTTAPSVAAHVFGTVAATTANQWAVVALTSAGLQATTSVNSSSDISIASKNVGNVTLNSSNLTQRDAKVACYSHLAVQGASRAHMRLWDKEDTTTGVYVSEAGAALSMSRGAATASLNNSGIGWNFSGAAMRFRIGATNSTTNGFTWEGSDEVPIMSLRNDGYLNLNKSIMAGGMYGWGGGAGFNGTQPYFYPMNDNLKYGNWRISGNRCANWTGLHFEESRVYLMMGNSGNTAATTNGVWVLNNGDWMWRVETDRQFYPYYHLNVLNSNCVYAYTYYANGTQFCDQNRNLINLSAVSASGSLSGAALQVGGVNVIDPNRFVFNINALNVKNTAVGACVPVLTAPLAVNAFAMGAQGTVCANANAFATTNASDAVRDVATDAINGFVYAVGRYTTAGTTVIPNMDGTPSVCLLPAAPSGAAFVIKYSAPGRVVGFSVLDGTGADSAYGACVDAGGNLYVVGTYLSSGTVSLNAIATAAVASGCVLPLSNSGAAFVVKWSSSGAVLGYAVLDGTGADVAYDVVTDAANNVCIAGSYVSSVAIPISTIALLPTASAGSLPISSGGAAFVIKYSAGGTLLGFATIDGNNGADAGLGLATDGSGNVVFGGYYFATAAVPIASLASLNVASGSTLPATSAGSRAGFVIKFAAAGTPTGIAVIDGTGADAVYDVGADASGNVYATGTFLSTGAVPLTTLATPPVSSSFMPASSTGAAFVVKWGPSGDLGGYSVLEGTGAADTGYCVNADAIGNVYACGYYTSTTPVPVNVIADGTVASAFLLPAAPSQAAYYVKFDAAGEVLGAASIDGTGADAAFVVCPDTAGNAYVGGFYVSTTTTALKNTDGTASTSAILPVSATASPFLVQYTPLPTSTPACTFTAKGALVMNKASPTPAVALDVSGSAAFSASVGVGKAIATLAALDVAGTAAVSGAAYAGSLGVGIATPGSLAAMVVNGATGIGTTAPLAMLHVDGNVYASGDVDAFYTASDARFKNDLRAITDFDAILEGITPYRFRWKRRPDQEDVGLIAQDVAAVLPEATRNTRDEHMSLDYTKLIPVLVAAVNASRRELAELRARFHSS